MRLRPGRNRDWPVSPAVQTSAGRVELRPLRPEDEHRFMALRVLNSEWLQPWDATTPENPDPRDSAASFRQMARHLTRSARTGTHLPWLIWFTADGGAPRLVGQLTVGPIIAGSAQTTSLGYWLDEGHAGRGITPMAVALAVDHLFFERGLHRVEIAVRPENAASLRVVEKLGFREEGMRLRFLHIHGAWRDHRCFALTREEIGDGLVARCRGSQSGVG
ncbi:GNAT family N-acetyltransferase [Nesterenkonia sp. LB17]|uniref:GNAT family N-acetyltransferase n=1 Tax=unclassified Nesterenkonia TaxID=2629769 RepID=UPI001F4D05FF|nr:MULTISPECIES: GNAT family protein [unclassified Nesterenkonia]MCH8561405.1 GNAT family N-acetyltransferase [Nesterenkonia sp. DZ6]MCH8563850.1 GNAT family N-acetyltransferase [Nesterenkonia sp. YGD6]MCH8566444.1 GNAT family N-acetyltransferase [Nesterenkonia sp. LB17]MCH8571989.1 GNAT family N-acetyltransferase [Nesterenkonia sp. AY15]